MTTYTYEQIYADACKGIIRSEADASLAGRHNGADCVVVVDRKCGECTPSFVPPTVKVLDGSSYGWAYTGTSVKTIGVEPVIMFLDFEDTKVPFNSSEVYAIKVWNAGNGVNNYGNTHGLIVTESNISGYMAVKKESTPGVKMFCVKIMSCDNASATVVAVYDNDNTRFDAFLYQNHYYVLDETHSEWVEDLSSIGYHIPTEYKALVEGATADTNATCSNQLGATKTSTLNMAYSVYLYESGNKIPYDESKTYTWTGYEYGDGVKHEPDETYVNGIANLPSTTVSSYTGYVFAYQIVNKGGFVAVWTGTNTTYSAFGSTGQRYIYFEEG